MNYDMMYNEWHGWIEGTQGKLHLHAINGNAADLSFIPDGSELSIQVNYPPERKAGTDLYRVVDFQVIHLNSKEGLGKKMGMINGKSASIKKQVSVKRSPVKQARTIPAKKKVQATRPSGKQAPGREQVYNRIELVGITGRDIECEFTNNGSQVLKCSMAVYMGKNKPNFWIDFQIWADNLGDDTVDQILGIGKGSKVKIIGRLCGDVWKTKEGTNRTRMYIVAEDIDSAGEIKPSEYAISDEEEDEEEEEISTDDEEEEEEEEEEEKPKRRKKARF